MPHSYVRNSGKRDGEASPLGNWTESPEEVLINNVQLQMTQTEPQHRVSGTVVIGRNEGLRLEHCLKSLQSFSHPLVYVDSGSTDNSVEIARTLGAITVSLDSASPFTAARARNEGLLRLHSLAPDTKYVQFVDGDCEIVPGWIETARQFLENNPGVVAVCGRLQERFPDRSIYNLLCNLEWDAPTGEVSACGGIAMFRIPPLIEIGCFRTDLIAGEEPELCFRLRQAGWKIWRLEQDMALHDAAMLRFQQWWTRTMRGGFAAGQGAHLYGSSPEQYKVRESRRMWLWGLVLPLGIAFSALLSYKLSIALSLLYPAQVVRIALLGKHSTKENWYRALFLVLGKFPEVLGQIKFLRTRFAGRRHDLIEYK